MNTKKTKTCNCCKIAKEIAQFTKNKKSKDGLSYLCKPCRKLEKQKYRETDKKRQREYNKENKEKIRLKRRKYNQIHKEHNTLQHKLWCRKNKKKVLEYNRKYALENKGMVLEKSKKRGKDWRTKPENKTKQCEYIKRRYKIDIKFNINMRMSNNIRLALKGNKNGRKWESLVGYTKDDLKSHLQSQFTGDMTWEKYLNGDIEIDHTICRQLFEYESPEDPQFKACWALNNLSPIWFIENRSKNDFLPDGRQARNLSKEEKLEYLKSLGYNF